MTRSLTTLMMLAVLLGARELSELTPYLDRNTTDTFRSLVVTHGDANARRSDNNKTILMYAVWVGNDDAVYYLMAKGADVNARDAEGVTPLLLAIFKDRTDIALSLIDHGADVKTSANDGTTPLMMARVRGNERVEQAILEQIQPTPKETTP